MYRQLGAEGDPGAGADSETGPGQDPGETGGQPAGGFGDPPGGVFGDPQEGFDPVPGKAVGSERDAESRREHTGYGPQPGSVATPETGPTRGTVTGNQVRAGIGLVGLGIGSFTAGLGALAAGLALGLDAICGGCASRAIADAINDMPGAAPGSAPGSAPSGTDLDSRGGNGDGGIWPPAVRAVGAEVGSALERSGGLIGEIPIPWLWLGIGGLALYAATTPPRGSLRSRKR